MQEIFLDQVAENGASGTAIQTGKCAEETKSCGLRTKDKFTQANYEPTQEIRPSVCPPINRKENPPNARTVFRLFFTMTFAQFICVFLDIFCTSPCDNWVRRWLTARCVSGSDIFRLVLRRKLWLELCRKV